MSFLISSKRTNERDALSEVYYILSDVLNYKVKPLKSRVPGLSILKLEGEKTDPFVVLDDLRNYITEKGPLIACLKLVPMEVLIKTDLPLLKEQISELAKERIEPFHSWRITLNKRQCNLRSTQIIEEVADKINWGTVKMKTPDLEIRIEIVRDLTGISIMPPNSEISMMKITLE